MNATAIKTEIADTSSSIAVGRSSLPILSRHGELEMMCDGVDFFVDPALQAPFCLAGDNSVVFAATLLRNSVAAAVMIRHAVELMRWRSSRDAADDPSWQLARGLLAMRCAAHYLAGLAEVERSEAEQSLPAVLVDAYRAISGDDWSELRAVLGGAPNLVDLAIALEPTTALDRRALLFDPLTRTRAFNAYASLAPLAAPVEHLLATGGDPRIAIDKRTGCNGYGSANLPQLGIFAFSSSTASTISPGAYSACEALRIRLMNAAAAETFATAATAALAEIRADLAELLGLSLLPGSEVILTASGTDTELVAVALATAGHADPLTSIVVAPDETGSGIPQAAAGRHFLDRAALANKVVAGSPLTGLDGRQIRISSVDIRDGDGRTRPLSIVDQEVEADVDRAIAAGGRVLLNVLDCSKTGHGAPSIGLVKRLAQRHGHRLTVVVDCCQMRLSATSLRGYVAAGFLVQITGSKFFGGPPFSGALLVPPAVAARAAKGLWLPPGLTAYCARAEWPQAFAATTRSLTDTINFGLLFRWTAALHEIARAGTLDSDDCEATMADLDGEFVRLIADYDRLDIVEATPLDRSSLGVFDGWAEFRTIFPVTMLRDGPAGEQIAVGIDDAKLVHRWLNQSLAAKLPPGASIDDRNTASALCLVGQPVKIAAAGGGRGAIRLCIDARQLARIVEADSCDCREQRMAAVMADLGVVLRKLDLILSHFEYLKTQCG